jgi:tetratricopeptide (TPR) repeat protein
MGADSPVIRTRADLVEEVGRLRTKAARGRGLRQVSLAVLAREAGVPRSTLHTYVTGATLPPADVLDRIVIALGGTPAEQRRCAEAWDRVSANEHQRLVRPEPVVTPAQLPRATGLWGREPELAALDELLLPQAGAHLVLVVGAAGVGKSALVTRWGQRTRERFPDGQLYADLGDPAEPGTVLARFLRAFGVPAPRIPHDTAEASALYRSVLAGKSLLCVLDNAADPAQVRPLLPAAADCAVLITSRNRLDGLVALDGAHRLTLDVLAEPDAVALLAAAAGPDRAGEPATLAGIARQCGYLPLALRITAAQLARRPGRPLADHLADLSGRTALDAFTVDGASPVRAAHELSYRTLDRATRRTFRLLGLAPGPDVTAPAAAALTRLPLDTAARHLDQLAAAHLAQEHAPGRYRLHELLRRYAAERADTDDTGQEREAAVRALLRHYLHRADAATDRLYPFAMRLPRPRPAESAFPDDDTARAWLDTELPNLVAAVRHAHATGRHLMTWQLVDALRGHCQFNLLPEGADLARMALEAAETTGRPDARAAAHNNLAATHALHHEFEPAIDHFNTARRLARTLGSRSREIVALQNLAQLYLTTGDVARAATALDATAALGHTPDPPGLLHRAVLQEYRGRLEEAIALLRQALAEHRDPCGLLLLARVIARTGRYEAGRPAAEAALAEARRCGDVCTETHAHALLALIHAGAGNLDRALAAAETAVRQAPKAEPTAETAGHTALATVRCLTGDHEAAVRHAEHALRVSRRAGTRFEECEALLAGSRAHHGAGDHGQAHQSLRSAQDLARDNGFDGLAEQAAALSRRLDTYLTA